MRACDYAVYKIEYYTTYAERVSTYGGMDSELTGQKITEKRTYLVVAPHEEFAITAFKRYHSKDEMIKIEVIGYLDDIVRLQ
jgi:hypothetical protein